MNETLTHRVDQDFVTAGKATFTLVGRQHRYTYRVEKVEPEAGSRYTQPSWFVKVLTGSDNTRDYSYLGVLDVTTGYVRLTRKSRLTSDSPAVKALQWALPKLWNGTLPAGVGVYHDGNCGKCGRLLTVPSSVLTGLGPECAANLGVTQVDAEPKVKRTRKVAAVATPAAQAETVVPVSLTELFSKVKTFDRERFLVNELPA